MLMPKPCSYMLQGVLIWIDVHAICCTRFWASPKVANRCWALQLYAARCKKMNWFTCYMLYRVSSTSSTLHYYWAICSTTAAIGCRLFKVELMYMLYAVPGFELIQILPKDEALCITIELYAQASQLYAARCFKLSWCTCYMLYEVWAHPNLFDSHKMKYFVLIWSYMLKPCSYMLQGGLIYKWIIWLNWYCSYTLPDNMYPDYMFYMLYPVHITLECNCTWNVRNDF